MEIVLVLKSLHQSMCRTIEKVSKKYGVTGVQFLVLKFLLDNEDKDVYQKDIEKLIDVRGSTATVILQKLTQKDCIERVSCSNDGRLKKIVLSKKAKGMIEEFEKEMKIVESNIERNISEEERKVFSDVIAKIKQNLEIECQQK